MKSFDEGCRLGNVLLGQRDLIAKWSYSSLPVVSIVCCTYNHEGYIEDAIKGFLGQKTSFSFEIILHDDCSSDKTSEIIKRYANAYPEIIKPIFQLDNQYSKGVRVFFNASSYAQGEYLAFCEGDDYWISPHKLQRQVDALRFRPEPEICFHSAIKTIGDFKSNSLFCKYAGGDQIFSVSTIIRCGGSFMPTASMMIRRSFFDRAFSDKTGFFKKHMTGYFYQIFCSLKGGALYIDQPMSVYRSMADGSWSEQMEFNQEYFKKWLSNYLSSLREADMKTNYKYSQDIMVPIRRCHISVLNNVRLSIRFREDHYIKNKNEIGFAGRFLWCCVFRFSLVHSVFNRLRQMAALLFSSVKLR